MTGCFHLFLLDLSCTHYCGTTLCTRFSRIARSRIFFYYYYFFVFVFFFCVRARWIRYANEMAKKKKNGKNKREKKIGYLLSTPPSRDAFKHSGGDSLRWTSPTVTLYFDVELSNDRRPGTLQNTSEGVVDMPVCTTKKEKKRQKRLIVTLRERKKSRKTTILLNCLYERWKKKKTNY